MHKYKRKRSILSFLRQSVSSGGVMFGRKVWTKSTAVELILGAIPGKEGQQI